jgi:GH3 auxin-responsive promoter
MRFRVTDFTIAPYFNKNEAVGGHEWFIEFDQAPDDLIAFEKAIDDQLKVENADYEAKRFLDLNIGKPKFHYLAKGSFHQWLANRQKLGGQHKIPRLMNDRKLVEQLLSETPR